MQYLLVFALSFFICLPVLGADRTISQTVDTTTARVQPAAIGFFRGESVSYTVTPLYGTVPVSVSTNATATWTVCTQTNVNYAVLRASGTVATNGVCVFYSPVVSNTMAAGAYDSFVRIQDGSTLVTASRSTLNVYKSPYPEEPSILPYAVTEPLWVGASNTVVYSNQMGNGATWTGTNWSFAAGSGISASTATGIVNGLAYPLTANPSNYLASVPSIPLSTITNAGSLAASNSLPHAATTGIQGNGEIHLSTAETGLVYGALQAESDTLATVTSRGNSFETNTVYLAPNPTRNLFVLGNGSATDTDTDTNRLVLAANPQAAVSRGAFLSVRGNEYGSTTTGGDIWLEAGTTTNAGTGKIVFVTESGSVKMYKDGTWDFGGFTLSNAVFSGSGASLTGITAGQVGAVSNNQTGVRLNTMAIHNGFEDQYAQTVSFDPVTRTAICTPTGSTFKVTAGGVTYTSGAVTSSAGPEVSGNMFAYFRASDGAFICTNAVWGIIGGEAQAIYALYDHSNTSTVYVIDERHGVNISDSDHLMRHQTVGSTWASGITLSHFAQDTTAAAGANGTQTVIAVTDSGVFWDEDVKHATLANGTTANSTNTCGTFPIIWKDATTWHRDNGTVFPFFWSGDTPQYVTAAGSKTSVPEDNFFVYWLIAVGSSNGTNLFLASHPEVYATVDAAKSGATVANLSSLLGGFPNSELMVCYRLIFNHNAAAPLASPASVKSAKLRVVDDYRNTPGGVILAGTGPSAGSYELTAAKVADVGGWTNNAITINGVAVGPGSNVVVSGGNSSSYDYFEAYNTASQICANSQIVDMKFNTEIADNYNVLALTNMIFSGTGTIHIAGSAFFQTAAWTNAGSAYVRVKENGVTKRLSSAIYGSAAFPAGCNYYFVFTSNSATNIYTVAATQNTGRDQYINSGEASSWISGWRTVP